VHRQRFLVRRGREELAPRFNLLEVAFHGLCGTPILENLAEDLVVLVEEGDRDMHPALVDPLDSVPGLRRARIEGA